MLKRFFYASATVLMLALAYYFGASTATAQTGGGFVSLATVDLTGGQGRGLAAMTSQDDIYGLSGTGQWNYLGNSLSGSAPVQQESWGQLKTRFRGER